MTDKVFPESMREAIDYNFGTLIRANCEEDYTQENSIFGPSYPSVCFAPRPGSPVSL